MPRVWARGPKTLETLHLLDVWEFVAIDKLKERANRCSLPSCLPGGFGPSLLGSGGPLGPSPLGSSWIQSHHNLRNVSCSVRAMVKYPKLKGGMKRILSAREFQTKVGTGLG